MSIQIFTTISDLKACVLAQRALGRVVSFVPTMGALHSGHTSLVEAAALDGSFVVASIFVNPTQFNNPNDLLHYPRTPEQDVAMLEAAGCGAVFMPSVDEMYPSIDKGHWDYGILSSSFEGKFRPGHFDGVLTIVKRLFEIVMPDFAYFGEKDFQQLAHIRRFTEEEMPKIKVVGMPTVREDDGLAKSSRNMRLNPEQRGVAAHIPRILFDMREKRNDFSPAELEAYGRSQFELIHDIRLEYLEIVDRETFAPLPDWGEPFQPVLLVAAYVGDIRLIDNLSL